VAQGAEVLIPTCGVLNQVLRENKVRDVSGCPILDGSSVLLKLTEAMVDLRRTIGLGHVGTGITREVMREIEAAYGVPRSGAAE
jgi:hypothetical protein